MGYQGFISWLEFGCVFSFKGSIHKIDFGEGVDIGAFKLKVETMDPWL